MEGSLGISSSIRINKIFTADKAIILYKIGKVNNSKIEEITKNITNMFLV